MNQPSPFFPALLLAAFSCWGAAPEPPWLPGAWETSQAAIQALEQAEQMEDEDKERLSAPSPALEETVPAEPDEDNGHSSVITAQGGMLFDVEQARVAYFDQVVLTDARLVLQARERLSIQLNQQVRHQAQTTLEASAQQTQQVAPVPAAATEDAAPSPQAGPPLLVTTDAALVDARENRIYLRGREVSLSQGGNRLVLPASPGKLCQVLADSNGDIAIQAPTLLLRFQDKAGMVSTLVASGGRAYYHNATRELALPGPCRLEREGDRLECDGLLLLSLAPDPEGETAVANQGGSFMSQFTSLRFHGISRAQAWGHVRLASAARERRPAASATGDTLVYEAEAGRCWLEGAVCTLSYGANRLEAPQGRLCLEPNGDLFLQGSSISGVYERPGAHGQPPLTGTFAAQQVLRFLADSGTVSTDHGLQAQDAAAQFSCTGPVELTLARRPGATPTPPSQTGGLNLALLEYGEVAHARVSGQVEMQLLNQEQPSVCELAFSSSEAEGDLLKGELSLTSVPGVPARARFRGYALEARSAASLSTLYLAPNGDVLAQGEQVDAQADHEGSTFRARCEQRLALHRQGNTVEVGPHAVLESASGILTTQGSVQLRLEPAPASSVPLSRYPQFQYDYLGVREARTEQGGTARSTQGSMECRGPIHLTMDPSAAGDEFGGLRSATASDHVALAGKDNTGRLMKATGDRLVVDGVSGTKRLTGSQVTVGDAFNMHVASGRGAAIVIDKDNRVRISGERQSTIATGVRSQIEQQKQKKGNR